MYLDFLNSYLEPRIGHVAVEGVLSEVIDLTDTVFQGTVLGPTLWNVFFQDVTSAATAHGGEEQKSADDLSISKPYPLEVSNDRAIEAA